jgi:cation diffusion facilitator family transporter
LRAATRPGQKKAGGENNVVVIAALLANLGIAIAKFVAAAITGSSAMLTEAFHSVVDTTNEVLLLYGQKRAKRAPDAVHPLGYGRELYFWSFVVALLIFAVGAGFSIYEGVLHILEPEPIEDATINYVVLGVAALLEGTSWVIALRQFNRDRGETGAWRAIKDSKDPPGFIVLLEDSAALAGIGVAALGVFLTHATGDPSYDGAASIAIGLILAAVAIVLAREAKHLLIGERGDPALTAAIAARIAARPEVSSVNDVMTVHLSPEQIVAIASVDFVDTGTAGGVEQAIREVRGEIHRDYPAIWRVYVTPRDAADEASPPAP